jgi:hypothetical protein
MSDLRAVADKRFDEAIAASGARDPRDFYRDRLRGLRTTNPEGFRAAVDYYENTLIPEVAQANGDPLAAWLEYGRHLATICAPGQTVQIDPSGRRIPYSAPVPLDHLVLHIPTSAREPAIAVGLPPQLSPAQRATYDLLVSRKTA